MSYTPQPGTIPAKAIAALSLIDCELSTAQLLEAIGQPVGFKGFATCMALAVERGAVLTHRDGMLSWWRRPGVAEGVRANVSQMVELGAKLGAAESPAEAPAPKPHEHRLATTFAQAVPSPQAGKPAPLPVIDIDPPPGFLPGRLLEPYSPSILQVLEDEAALREDLLSQPPGAMLPIRVVPSTFDCALSANGRLTIVDGPNRVDLDVGKTRKVLAYLDRLRPEEDGA